MEFTSEKIQALFSEIGTDWSPRNKESVCEALWEYYSECNPAQDIHAKQTANALEPYFQGISPDTEDALFMLIAKLCCAYQRAAFLDGLRFAFRMHDELT